MPDQVLTAPAAPRRPADLIAARLLFAVLWLAVSAAFAVTLYHVLSVATPTGLQIAFLVLSTLCFAWVAAGSTSALIGFLRILASCRTDTLVLPPGRAPTDSRTALLFPAYREDPAELATAIETMCAELEAAGADGKFDVFVLSDTQSPAERQAEARVLEALCRRRRAGTAVYFRWRTPNLGKKAGNIREWIERFGAAYRYFVVLDADSLMTADTLVRLVAAMDAYPRVALIQTVPKLCGGHTLLARLQQFAGDLYGPVVAAGLAAWHGPGGNYWGHNAIIRTAAFAECAGLPALPGSPPLGGPIMSHDFVEAALLRRGGWEVHMAPALEGSYEGCPPTLTELVTRDRRWAQGNLQHLRLLGADGLPLLSRLHLAMGAIAYLAAPVWALTLAVGVALALQASLARPDYFGTEVSLFPNWPVFDAETALALFIATMLVVHLPKLLGGALALRDPHRLERRGGAIRIVGGILVESLLSTLLAPILMVSQTGAVLGILAGRDAGWRAQSRGASGSALGASLRQYRWQVLWGVTGACVCLAVSPAVLAWMSPILGGLIAAPLLAHWTAHSAGAALSRLLTTIEDRHPPPLLASLARRRAAKPAAVPDQSDAA